MSGLQADHPPLVIDTHSPDTLPHVAVFEHVAFGVGLPVNPLSQVAKHVAPLTADAPVQENAPLVGLVGLPVQSATAQR